MRKLTVSILALLCALIFATTTGGTLRFVVGADAVTLLPGNFSDGASALVASHIFEGLVELDEKNQIQPLLAERWEVSPKADVYTFYLRRGIKFHDGTDFTAAAVKKHFDYLLANKFRRSGMFRAVLKEVKVINDYTVQFILHEPFAPFLYYLAHEAAMIPSPASIDRFGKEPATLGKNPVGTGPFIFQEWKVGEGSFSGRTRTIGRRENRILIVSFSKLFPMTWQGLLPLGQVAHISCSTHPR